MTDPSEVHSFLNSLQQQSAASGQSNEHGSVVIDTHEAIYERAGKIGLFTANACVVPGWRVVQTLPMITARRVLGINAWQDFAIAIRDFVGGRSQAAETAFGRLEAELLQELQVNAAAKRCHAVIGVNVQFGEISGGGKAQLFYAAAQGTPVLMEPVATPTR